MRYCILVCAGSVLVLTGCVRQGVFAPAAPNASIALRPSTAPLPRRAQDDIAHGDAASFRVLHDFKGAPDDGQRPVGRLTELSGALYGTTELGGTYNAGTVFEIGADGKERVFLNFNPGFQYPFSPRAGLILRSGAFYGTTLHGGTAGDGTVYVLTLTATPRILHSFTRSSGAGPRGDLTYGSGSFYGTTEYGGAHGMGTVFSVSLGGDYHVLHSFAGGNDGANPRAGLQLLDRKLYGTTYSGGVHDKGTVFEITLNGAERTLHSFAGKPKDGAAPQCRLVALNGSLYGTTATGGEFGFGTIFEVKPDGTEQTLFDFDGKDGELPLAGLTVFKGLLYGTASESTSSYGNVFEFDPATRHFRALHDFGGGDGAVPRASLLEVNGTLYGTTAGGGTKLQGVVFEVTP